MKYYALWFLALIASAAGDQPRPLWAQMQDAVLIHPNVVEVRRVLDAGFDPNGSIGCGDWPAILGAVERRDVEMTRALLERGAKIPDQAMLIACGTYDMDLALIKILVEHGGNVNAKNARSSCLHTAVWHKNKQLTGFLSKTKGIDLNIVCHDGDYDGTPLMWALRIGATEVAEILLKAGADVNVKGETGATVDTIISERIHSYENLRATIEAKRL